MNCQNSTANGTDWVDEERPACGCIVWHTCQREFVERIAQATLDWWDFDGSYREANGFDGEIDVDAIFAEVKS